MSEIVAAYPNFSKLSLAGNDFLTLAVIGSKRKHQNDKIIQIFSFVVKIIMLHSLKRFLISYRIPSKPSFFSFPQRGYSNPFCTVKYPPAITQLLQITDVQQLPTSLIEIYKLNDNNKRIAIKIIMKRVEERIFPQNVLVEQKFQIHLKRFPDLLIDAFLYRIQGHLKKLQKLININNQVGKKLAVKDINTCFTIIFQALKKLPRNQLTKYQIKVYIQFANYHQNYLMQLIEHKKYKEILSKSLEFYKAALTKISNYVQKDQSGVKPQLDIDDFTEETANQYQKTYEYKIYHYSEKYCQILYETMSVQNYITDPRIKQSPRPRSQLSLPFIYHQGLFDLIPLFEIALDLLEKTVKEQSKFYYKIKKTHMEFVYHRNIHNFKEDQEYLKKERANFIQKMDQFTEQIIQNLRELPNQREFVQLCEQMTLVLLGVKLYKISLLNKNPRVFQQLLVKQIQSILQLIQEKDLKKLVLTNLSIAVSTTMKINLQKYFGKMPRPIVYSKRRSKTDQEEGEEEEQGYELQKKNKDKQ